jgi:hypothetical protein
LIQWLDAALISLDHRDPARAGGSPGNLTGIVELEIDQVDVRPDYALNAIAIEIVNPAGDGVRCRFDLGEALDFALRIAVACARLRGITGTTP